MDNIILMTDSYKISHWKQYPPKTEHVYSYFESRGGMYDKIMFFGLQYLIRKHLQGGVVDAMKIDQAEEFCKNHFGTTEFFNRAGWEYIVKKYNGRLPVRIAAVPEGQIHDTHDVLFTVENTDPECFWLTSYLETLLEQVWYPCTVATRSFHQKHTIKQALSMTGDPASIGFKLHDFGYRGSTSQESAAIGGAAHLINFMGTDTIAAITLLQKYYHAESMPGFSIPAAEHSTITSWGKSMEVEAYRNMLNQFPKGLVAVVSDSYDIFNACKNLWGDALKDQVMNREGILVIRPDSGDPAKTVLEVLEVLGEAFGTTMNEKSWKMLPPQVRVIQGDGIDEKSLPDILKTIMWKRWSVDNLAFGSGGGLLQNMTRDTLQFAYKCSNVTVDGVDRPVSKNPVTDPTKISQQGRVGKGLRVVFENGVLLIDQELKDIKNRAEAGLERMAPNFSLVH